MPRNLLAAIFLMLCFGLPTFSQALESKSGHAQEVASYIPNAHEPLPERIRVRDPATTGSTEVQSDRRNIPGMSEDSLRSHDRLQRPHKTPSR
jgi:hypothetical protein